MDLLWCYPKTTRYSVNFLPLGEVSATVVYATRGPWAERPLEIPVRVGAMPTDSLLEVLAQRAPAAFIGYRPEWATRWSSVRASVLAEHGRRAR